MPLPSSFWVDETGTLFVVREGAQHPSLAVAPQVTASIYFWLPRAADCVLAFLPKRPGVTEAVYRSPSVLAMALALVLIAWIADRLIHPGAGWFATFACLALRGVDYEAADARPYALGILVVSAAALFLIRWLDTARVQYAVLFVVFAALIVRVHLLFWPFYIVLLVYASVRLNRANWKIASAFFVAVGVTLIPVALEALALSRHASEHVIAAVPSPGELLRELKFGLIFVSLVIAGALRIGTRREAAPKMEMTLILGWWLTPPVALFAFPGRPETASSCTGISPSDCPAPLWPPLRRLGSLFISSMPSAEIGRR